MPDLRNALRRERRLGTVSAADLSSDDAPVTQDELAAFAAARLAYFEVPSRWHIGRDELPKNPTGKILKRVIRDTWMHGSQHANKEET